MSAPTVPSAIGQRGLQLRAILDVLRLDDVLDDLVGQVGREVGDLVGVEVAAPPRRSRRCPCPRAACRAPHRTTSSRISPSRSLPDEAPDEQAVLERQAFEDVGDVGRDAAGRALLQVGDVLLVHEALDELGLARALLALAVHEALDEPQLRDERAAPHRGASGGGAAATCSRCLHGRSRQLGRGHAREDHLVLPREPRGVAVAVVEARVGHHRGQARGCSGRERRPLRCRSSGAPPPRRRTRRRPTRSR